MESFVSVMSAGTPLNRAGNERSSVKFKLFALITTSMWLTSPTFAQNGLKVTEGETPGANSAACPQFASEDRAVNSTIQARLTELIDSSHLKPGNKVFAKVLYPITFADCSLTDEAILYGHVTAAASSKNPDSSELGLVFDHADCTGHGEQDLRLRLIGLVAPPRHGEMLHQVLPSEVEGGVQQLPATSGDGIDDNLSPEKYPATVRSGLVVRMPTVKLEPDEGPGCSARISSPARNIQLAPGVELILTLETVTKSK
jgi:hypothetical protein